MGNEMTPFERIRRTNPAGNEFWSSRDFAIVLGYTDCRNFEAVVEKARTACFNSGQRVEDHFVEITEMIELGKGAQRQARTVMMSRYACYLVIQNADPGKEIVAAGQTYFAVQTLRQELSDEETEEKRRLMIRAELRAHNVQLADAAKDAGVGTLKAKLMESPTLGPQAQNNTKEQFSASPDLRHELQNAVMASLDAHSSLSAQALNDPKIMKNLLDILLTHAGLWEALRERRAA